jgi:hypothetical protein
MIDQIGKGMGRMMMANLGTEVLYAFVIILCSLMIYFGTREIYNLSKHKGIKYFRLAFLFFALAYFSRTFIKFIVIYFNSTTIMSVSPRLLNPLVGIISLFLFIYLSTMAIFYLLYSVMWKKWVNFRFIEWILNIFALCLSAIIVFSANSLFYLLLNLGLFFVVLFVVIISRATSKKRSHKTGIYPIYLLLLFFWILNIVDILLPKIFQTTQILIYLASLGIFLFMLYKVLRNVGK